MKAIVKYLLYFALITTPIFGIVELIAVLPGLKPFLSKTLPIFYIKLLKDVLLGTIILAFGMDLAMRGKIVANYLLWAMLFFVAFSFVFTYLYLSPTLSLIGLRVLSSFVLILVAYRFFSLKEFAVIVKILLSVAVFECFIAFFQMLFGSPIHGINYLGLSARPFGTFVYPWSLAVFLCVVVAVKMGYDLYKEQTITLWTWGFIALAAFFVLMTGSGGGLICLSMIFASYFLFYSRIHGYLKASFLPILLLIPVLIFLNLAFFTGRRNVFESIEGRGAITASLLSRTKGKDWLIGKGLGLGSNAAVSYRSLSQGEGEELNVYITDSLYLSLFSQLGAIFLSLFVVFNGYIILKASKRLYSGINPVALLLIPAILTASFANSTIELFPVNWVLFLVYGLVLRGER